MYIVISVARQVDGEYVLIKPEKVFHDEAKANAHLEALRKIAANGPVTINTTNGDVSCRMELGVFEVEME